MMGWWWSVREHRPFSRRSRAALASAGDRARELRWAAPRSHEDHRPRAAPRRRAGGTPAAMTFDPHPSRVLRPDKAPPLLMSTEQKLEALGRAGMQGVAVVRFTHELSTWDPERFVRTVLVEWLHVAEVWVGANFLFGARSRRHVLGPAIARRALRLSRREDRSRSLQGLRRQQHARAPAGRRGPRRRGGGAPRPPLLCRWHRHARCRPRAGDRFSDRERVHRERARAALGRLRHARHHRRRGPSIDHEYRCPPDVWRQSIGRSSRRISSTSIAICMG